MRVPQVSIPGSPATGSSSLGGQTWQQIRAKREDLVPIPYSLLLRPQLRQQILRMDRLS